MKTTLQAGATVEFVTPSELAAAIDKGTRQWFQESARGRSLAEFDAFGNVSSGNLLIPGPADAVNGPEVGFAWSVQRITFAGLATNDTIKIFRSTTAGSSAAVDRNFMGQVTAANPVFHVGSKGLILRGEQRLTYTGASLSATAVTVNGLALEVAESDLYKLL